MLRKGRVLFVVGSLAVGGAESQILMLAERLKMRGWSVAVFALKRSGAMLEQFEQAGIHVSGGGYNSDGAIRAFVGLFTCQARLIWCLLRVRPDVVHGFLPLSNFVAALAGRIACVPRIITSKRALCQTSGPLSNIKMAGLDCPTHYPIGSPRILKRSPETRKREMDMTTSLGLSSFRMGSISAVSTAPTVAGTKCATN